MATAIQLNDDLSDDFLLSLKEAEFISTANTVIDELREVVKPKAARQDARSMQQLLELVARMEEINSTSGVQKWFPDTGEYSIHNLPKHKAFFDAGKDYPERLFMASNRSGKSVAGAFELTCHLTGEYPTWWNGRVFDCPINAWACGKDAKATRDTAQRELIGGIGQWGMGMIPAHKLGKFWNLQGTPQAIDTIQVKHKSGGWSILQFKNYQQDVGTYMGSAQHVVWMDEECPLELYNEANIRTAIVSGGEGGGIMLVTFTPLEGLTPMVVNFCKKADFLVGAKPIVAVDQTASFEESDAEYATIDRNKAVIQLGWDDVPWLTAEVKQRLLDDTPIYLRDARSKGIPAMGSGSVYPIPVEEVLVAPFAIPDSWPRMYALDVGWNRTAVLWGALDPATDTLYIYDEHYLGQQTPPVHAYAIRSRGEWITGVIDPASRGRSQVDGQKLKTNYKDLGLTLFDAKNEFESGILNVTQRLVASKIKVFRTLVNFQKEYLLYRRDKNGKVIKEDDHLLDCLRYIVNNLNRMSSKADLSFQRIKYAPPRYNI